MQRVGGLDGGALGEEARNLRDEVAIDSGGGWSRVVNDQVEKQLV